MRDSHIDKSWYSSKDQQWCTPSELFKSLDAEFHFTCDPAATHKSKLCSLYYTEEDEDEAN